MVTSDVIGDMFARIKNASMVLKPLCVVPHSKEKEEILKVLEVHHYIEGYTVSEDGAKKTISVKLSTEPKNKYVTLERISKPGRRMYIRSSEIYLVKGGRGILLISTSKGVKEGKQAKKEKLGGELLARLY